MSGGNGKAAAFRKSITSDTIGGVPSKEENNEYTRRHFEA